MKRTLFLVILIVLGITGCNDVPSENRDIVIIGGADGPTVIYVTSPKPEPESEPDEPTIAIERITSSSDKDGDGLNDTDDIIEGARKDVENQSRYTDGYYKGGYPPEDEGVCTDVIWRAFQNAGYNLKDMIDGDIRSNTDLYPRVEGKPDPNIDFRRVKNLCVFFNRHATVLSTEIIPGDLANLKKWQAGDIVVFSEPLEHIVILSDVRTLDGVPYIIHNSGPYTQENDKLIYWKENLSPIIGHYRFPPDSQKGP